MKKNPRLLVVDDEIDICNFVKSFFQMRGFEVCTALNGEEAMSRLLLERPDVIILDVMMQHGSEGLDYLPKIKGALPSAKVIMVTAVEDGGIVEAAREKGADDYITKPLVLEYLETTVLDKIKHLSPAIA
ncbi:MAG: response regulator [Candidatus Omnitrophota bacterium]